MLRRRFLQALATVLLGAATGLREALALSRPRVSFRHGVASGDPLPGAVIIWTRVSTPYADDVDVDWQVALDEGMRQVVQHGRIATGRQRDFTVKVDVSGLEPGQRYFYRFRCAGRNSPVGQTKTLPRGDVGEARFAVVSCSNYPAGFFNAYRDIAGRDDLDAVLHLGDYIYEYGLGDYATEHAEEIGRVPDPPGEALSLADYRRRHAQYKTDADSIDMLARLPLIAIWDDHEFTNDAWKGGAQNHQADEGSWPVRRDAALQAWFEWMPVRGEPAGAGTQIFRYFRWGELLTLIMLDTRLYGRDIQPNVGEDVSAESIAAALEDPARRMLGAEQEEWLRLALEESSETTWQLIGQQVMVARMEPPDLEPLVDADGPSYFKPEALQQVIASSKAHHPQVLDVWDGYPAAKEDFLRDLAAFANNPVVLSGDLHTAMAADLQLSTGGPTVAVEMMTTSVSSPGLSAYFPDKYPHAVRDGTLAQNPHFRFLDLDHRGWLCVTVTADECVGEWHLLDTVLSRDYQSRVASRLTARAWHLDEGLS